MKIALINENSQAAKNEMICSVLKKVVEPMGHEVFNYGMRGAEDPASLTYVQNGILAAVLLNSGAADYVITGCATKKPEAQLLGSAIGMKVMAEVPYIVGLDQWLPGGLDEDAKTYLKDFGAATASNGAVGLYHVENITPEAVKYGKDLIKENAQVYVVDDAELERVYKSYPVIWKKKDATPTLMIKNRKEHCRWKREKCVRLIFAV